MLTSDPALPPKPLYTHELHRTFPYKDTHSRPGQVTVSTNLIETEKVKQNEKTEEFVTNEGIRKKILGFPGGAVVENRPANAGETGSRPGLGRSHMPWSN